MKWDGRYYVRGHDKLVWNSGEPGAKYTAEDFVSAPTLTSPRVFIDFRGNTGLIGWSRPNTRRR
jgi:hypothetical protein